MGRRRLAHLLLLAAGTALVFCNTLRNGYHLDDVYHIVNNPELERFYPPWRHFLDERTITTDPSIVQYRPLLPLVYSIDFVIADALGVERVVVHHLGAVFTHFGTCVLLYFLFLDLLAATSPSGRRDSDLAFAAVFLFAVHPVSGVPINYVCARDLLMMQFFFVATLLSYVRLRRRGSGWAFVVAPALLALSLLAKQNSVVAPVVILLLDLLVLRDSPRSFSTWLRPLAFAVPVALFFVWTELVLGFSDLGELTSELSPSAYALTMAREHVFHYLRNFIWPFHMRPLARVESAWFFFEVPVLVGAGVIVASLVAAFRLARRAPLASFSILCYWVVFSPTSSFVPFLYLVMDYRQYPSLPFLCLLVVLGMTRIRNRRLAICAFLALAVYFSVSSFLLNRIWRTEKSLWEHTYRRGGEVLANVLYAHSIEEENPRLAFKLYREASSFDVYACDFLGRFYWKQGRLSEAISQFEHNVQVAPTRAFPHFRLATAYREAGRPKEALDQAVLAAELDPRNVEYLYWVARELLEEGEAAAALPYLERIERFVPGYEETDELKERALRILERR